MMKMVILKEFSDGETRVALSPEVAKKFIDLGFQIAIEKGAGANASFTDNAYKNVGVRIISEVRPALSQAQIVLKIRIPELSEIANMGKGTILLANLGALSDQKFTGVYAFPSFKYPAIEACGEAFIQRIIASLDDLELFSDEQDDLASTILENSNQLPYDTEGRVILPPALLEHAEIISEAEFVGRGSRFQIWNPSAYELHNSTAFARARSRGVTLRLRAEEGGLWND